MMDERLFVWLLAAAVILGVIVMLRRASHGGSGRRQGGVGTGAAGAVYDLLNEDKRRAVDLIVEERAEATDPETADGKPPNVGPSDARPSDRSPRKQ